MKPSKRTKMKRRKKSKMGVETKLKNRRQSKLN